ncbi:MAG: T9SS type A sorting domain-containing protein [candidate division KSB1 bacterium]|nr:T9SS type A sorting domain-containing protein [candidate division KSB1 bacterium]MDZ7365620.1 T9SS type A sorting domain-containing protein [candidate division KSB1 bacterium]MDZ7403304.1 T9SS type A sorting domain-containing protein [candidate division KSB1 bacterium]
MRKCCYAVFNLLLIFLLAAPLQAQIEMPLAAQSAVDLQKEAGAICGAPFMREQEQEALKYLEQHPELAQRSLQKTAWNFTVGSQKTWYANDFRTNQRYLASSTCRAVGTRCYIFVEDAVWLDRVSQAAVDAFRNAFDSSTPANSTKGIYQTDVDTFGSPPDVDSDPKIIVLILDIKDQYSNTGSGGFIAGYFAGYNELPVTVAPQSNVAEILYIDANPLSLTTTGGLQFGLSTLAHEFQHMIHWNYDTDELTFINEACSEVASVVCGYPISEQSSYVNNTNVNLLSWQAALSDYSRAARFMTYVRDQIGVGVLKAIVQNPSDGAFGIDAALQSIGSLLRFIDIFKNFAIANILDDKIVNPAYGYTYPNLPKAAGRLLANPNVATTNSTVQHLGVEYLSFKHGADLKARFTVENASVLIKAVEIGPTGKRVVDVTPNVDFTEPAYGSTYSEIHFVVVNTNQAFPYGYTYQASGISKPVEQKWDATEPNGLLRLSPSDTICVTFDAISGGKLDSIRVALRRAGSITGGIWQFTGNIRPTPLGKRLAYPITASTNFNTPVVNPGVVACGSYPYPQPYPNWRKVDLQSFNISTDQPFAVAFVIRVPDTPAVMFTCYPGQSPYHNFTYLNRPSSGTPDWYYLVADESNILIYLIRAYISFPTTGVKQTVELEPRAFYLAQNYPNPFNPNTTIEFSLPRSGLITLKMFNALGEEVATLLQEKRTAGKHNVVWNASNMPSGVYFYRLEGEGFVETKRLLLMK